MRGFLLSICLLHVVNTFSQNRQVLISELKTQISKCKPYFEQDADGTIVTTTSWVSEVTDSVVVRRIIVRRDADVKKADHSFQYYAISLSDIGKVRLNEIFPAYIEVAPRLSKSVTVYTNLNRKRITADAGSIRVYFEMAINPVLLRSIYNNFTKLAVLNAG